MWKVLPRPYQYPKTLLHLTRSPYQVLAIPLQNSYHTTPTSFPMPILIPTPNHQCHLTRDLAADILATISPTKSASHSHSYHIHILEVVDLGFDFIHCAHVCLGLGLGFKELQKRILAG